MSSAVQEEYYYSPKYEDDYFEYRHVHIPAEVAKLVPKARLLNENEWRGLGIQQSLGWVHYMIHSPERHVLLFRRPKPGVDPEVAEEVAAKRDAGVADTDAPPMKASSADGAGAAKTGSSANFEAMRIH